MEDEIRRARKKNNLIALIILAVALVFMFVQMHLFFVTTLGYSSVIDGFKSIVGDIRN
jgi:hypothetical protein